MQFAIGAIGGNYAPRRFDLAAGEWIDVDVATSADGAFDVEVHGPAGFVRRFSHDVAELWEAF